MHPARNKVGFKQLCIFENKPPDAEGPGLFDQFSPVVNIENLFGAYSETGYDLQVNLGTWLDAAHFAGSKNLVEYIKDGKLLFQVIKMQDVDIGKQRQPVFFCEAFTQSVDLFILSGEKEYLVPGRQKLLEADIKAEAPADFQKKILGGDFTFLEKPGERGIKKKIEDLLGRLSGKPGDLLRGYPVVEIHQDPSQIENDNFDFSVH
jgi:hypothetical protein